MVNVKLKTIEDLNTKLQSLKAEKLKFYKKTNDSYDEMTYRRPKSSFEFEEDIFSKSAESIASLMH